MSINWENLLTEANIFITAVDIGCSSGRPNTWEKLGSSLRYVGVDPLVAEIERLQKQDRPNSTYLTGFIDFPGAKGYADEVTSNLFIRTSAYKVAQESFDSQKIVYNSGKDVVLNERKIGILDVLEPFKGSPLDLLKIDIDSDDFLCLKNFESMRTLDSLLLLDIESQFHGNPNENGNNFWNIGKLANQKNLHLYDLSINRYSRAVLPSKFVYNFPAQTHFGQTLWGDSLFLKDGLTADLQINSIIKLIALYEINGLYDCAIESLEKFQEPLNKIIPTDEIRRDIKNSHSQREATALTKGDLKSRLRKYVRKF